LAERARKLGIEKAQQISETKKRMFEFGELIHPFVGRSHSKETKDRISEKRKKYYETNDGYWKGRCISEEAKEKMSNTRTEKWANGEYDHIKMAWAKGKYFFQKAGREVWYRSSWELAFMKYLDSKDDVVSCDYESVRIPYYGTDGDKRNYIPDFLIEYRNKKELVEIKPYLRKDSEVNKRKFKAAREYCKDNNIKFKVISERYLKHIGAI
jgi:hypothetical protein